MLQGSKHSMDECHGCTGAGSGASFGWTGKRDGLAVVLKFEPELVKSLKNLVKDNWLQKSTAGYETRPYIIEYRAKLT